MQSGAWERLATDGDEDGDGDMYDEEFWTQDLGHTLQVLNTAAWLTSLLLLGDAQNRCGTQAVIPLR